MLLFFWLCRCILERDAELSSRDFGAERFTRDVGQRARIGGELLQLSVCHSGVQLGQPLPLSSCMLVRHGDRSIRNEATRSKLSPQTLVLDNDFAAPNMDIVSILVKFGVGSRRRKADGGTLGCPHKPSADPRTPMIFLIANLGDKISANALKMLSEIFSNRQFSGMSRAEAPWLEPRKTESARPRQFCGRLRAVRKKGRRLGGRSFSSDMKTTLSSGVLTPEEVVSPASPAGPGLKNATARSRECARISRSSQGDLVPA